MRKAAKFLPQRIHKRILTGTVACFTSVCFRTLLLYSWQILLFSLISILFLLILAYSIFTCFFQFCYHYSSEVTRKFCQQRWLCNHFIILMLLCYHPLTLFWVACSFCQNSEITDYFRYTN